MKQTANFLAIDLGASSGRVLLGRWTGARFDLHEVHRFPNAPVSVLGHLHWDVLRLWTEITTGLARYAALFEAPLAGIGIASWGVDFALLDQAGTLLGNPYTYRDARTNGMVAAVCRRVPPDVIFGQTGIQFLPINTLYQLYSMAQTADPQLAAATTLLLIPDLFHYWLTGRMASEYTNATTTQCFDCHNRQWATDLLAQLDLPTHLLPPIIAPGTSLGAIHPAVQQEVGLRAPAAVIVPATHDTASAVAAVPGLDAHSAYISSGTWSLVGVEVSQPVTTPAAQALNLTNEGGVADTIRLLKNVAGLWLLQECQRQWQRTDQRYSWEELQALAAQAPPFRSLVDPDDPAFLNPPDMPAAIRAYCRATHQPEPATPGAIVRCCLESLALKYRWVLGGLERVTGRRITTLRIVGGGSQNSLLCQLTADACARPVVAGPVEATACGNLLIQALAHGCVPDLAAGRAALAASVTLRTYEPSSSQAWDHAFVSFDALVGLTTAVVRGS